MANNSRDKNSILENMIEVIVSAQGSIKKILNEKDALIQFRKENQQILDLKSHSYISDNESQQYSTQIHKQVIKPLTKKLYNSLSQLDKVYWI